MMRFISVFVALFLTQPAFAKCWSAGEIPPSYCVEGEIKKIEKTEQGCIALVNVKKFSIPRAESQSLSNAMTLKEKREVSVNIQLKTCEMPRTSSLKGIMLARCNDKGQVEKATYNFYPGESQKTLNEGVQKEFVDCSWK
jgi:hypothetical protein